MLNRSDNHDGMNSEHYDLRSNCQSYHFDDVRVCPTTPITTNRRSEPQEQQRRKEKHQQCLGRHNTVQSVKGIKQQAWDTMWEA